jgi:FixJ family two-component response regulator/anti-sigma regulatory factor (Ser/Thr protein kinase)
VDPADVLIVDDDDATRQGLCTLLRNAGFTVDEAADGASALTKIDRRAFNVVLLDMQLPGIGGLDVLARCVSAATPSKVIVVTGVDPTDTALNALRGRAYEFIPKPIQPQHLIDVVRRALATADVRAIEVVSARPEWVELLVPCTREAVERIQGFLRQLDADLPGELRESVGFAFRELLLNGIEWGGGLDPNQKVRVACLHARRMILYRISDPGPGFTFDNLAHAAIGKGGDGVSHDLVRQKMGIRPGGFGLVLVGAIADELIYNEQQNEVVFVKYLDQPPVIRPDTA